MAIRVKPRAVVTPEVLEFYSLLAKHKINDMMLQLKQSEAHRRKWMLSKNKVMIAKLAPVARGIKEAGQGLDHELARLRALDYDRIEIEDGFLVAKTRDIVIEQLDSAGRRGNSTVLGGYWDAGPYWIYIPKEDLVQGSMNNIQFIPQRAPNVCDRHPHHYAWQEYRYGGYRDYLDGVDIRGANTHTCWGQFAEPLSGAMQDGDLVETLRMLRIFVGRYYSGSPLRRPERMEFMTWRNDYEDHP
jgi:hypothetical protein